MHMEQRADFPEAAIGAVSIRGGKVLANFKRSSRLVVTER
jgi:hypothetical protein